MPPIYLEFLTNFNVFHIFISAVSSWKQESEPVPGLKYTQCYTKFTDAEGHVEQF